eukprot:7295267-Prymnesium_polylepis.1
MQRPQVHRGDRAPRPTPRAADGPPPTAAQKGGTIDDHGDISRGAKICRGFAMPSCAATVCSSYSLASDVASITS